MATIFADDFNRANGAIANGWTIIQGTWETYSNYARTTGTVPATAIHSGFAVNPDVSISMQILQPSATGGYYGLMARSDVNVQNTYWCRYYWVAQATGPYIDLYKRVNGNDTQLHRIYQVPDNTTNHTLRLRCYGTTIQIWVDAVLYLAITDDAIGGGDYAGMFSSANNERFENFSGTDEPSYTLRVTPSTVPVSSVSNILTLTTTANNWTPGNPGSPTFEVALGSISSQEVLDDHTATILYDAPGWLSTDTITDPLNGSTVDIGIGQIVSGDLTEILRRLGEFPIGQDVLTFLKNLAVDAPEGPENPEKIDLDASIDGIGDQTTVLDQVASIWGVLGAYGPDYADAYDLVAFLLGLAQKNHYTVIEALSQLLSIRTVSNYTLGDVLSAIAAIEGADIQPILDQLAAIRTPSDFTFGSVEAWIAGVRGNDNRSLTEVHDELTGQVEPVQSAIFDSLAAYRGISLYTVQDIIDAINALGEGIEVDLTPVIDLLNALTGDGAHDLAEVLAAIAAVRGSGNPDLAAVIAQWAAWRTVNGYTAQSILDAIQAIRTGNNLTLQDVIDAIGAPPAGAFTAPVWPGLANVDLGAPVALGVGVTVNGPMHGVLIHVTSVGGTRQHFTFDTDLSHVRIGAITFQTDNGYDEFSQLLGFEQAVYTPKSMQSAAKALLRCGNDVVGTVTPWAYKP